MVARRRKATKRKTTGKKRTRKRATTMRRRRTTRSTRIPRQMTLPSIMPQKAHVPFKTCQLIALTSGTSEFMALADMTPNNLADPWGAASSTIQPVGFDQWAAFYNRYRVTKVKIGMQFSKGIVTSAQNLSAVVGYRFDQTLLLAVTSDFQDVCAAPRTRWRYVPANEDAARTQQVKMKTTVYPASMFKEGNKRNLDTLMTPTDPVNMPHFTIFCVSATGAALANTMNAFNVLITMEFTGFFHDRKLLPESVI